MIAVIGGLACGASATAKSFKINPVQVALPPNRQSASLTISNSAVVPVSVRMLAYRWTQFDGRDVYTPTSDVIASPPMFTIAPGKTQLIRIGLKTATRTGAYRLIFDEIPRGDRVAGQVQVTLRLNLPLYLLPEKVGAAALHWRTWTDRSGALFAEGRNDGNLHAQIAALSTSQSGKKVVLSQQMGVVLPGSARLWELGRHPEFSVGQPLMLTILSSTGEAQTRTVLEQR